MLFLRDELDAIKLAMKAGTRQIRESNISNTDFDDVPVAWKHVQLALYYFWKFFEFLRFFLNSRDRPCPNWRIWDQNRSVLEATWLDKGIGEFLGAFSTGSTLYTPSHKTWYNGYIISLFLILIHYAPIQITTSTLYIQFQYLQHARYS